MQISIRQEQPSDYPAVEHLVEAAFAEAEFSDQTEHLLVARLRKSPAFVPELSLVAESGGEIVGYILLTRLQISDGEKQHEVLGLAPVAVLPEFQNRGIGAALIIRSHEIAKAMNFGAVVLLGHAEYYPRFGYQPVSRYGIKLPFEAPDENCMILELQEGFLQDVQGEVIYPQAFFE